MIVTDEVLISPAHVYREVATEKILPGVTTILRINGYIDTRFFNELARQRGTAAHLAIHYLEKGTLDPFSIDPAVAPYVESYETFKATSGFRVLYHEKLVYHPVYRYAGSLDTVGILNGEEVLIDFKTGEVAAWAGLQTAAYNACLGPTSTGRPRKRFGLRLFGDGKIAKLEPFTDPQEEPLFFGAVASYYWRLKNNELKFDNDGQVCLAA